MYQDYISPNFVIELNPDYTMCNHSIHTNALIIIYYRKRYINQDGGTMNATNFTPNCRKFFTQMRFIIYRNII